MNGASIGALMDDAVRRLAGADIEHPRRNAEWLLCEELSLNRAGLYANLAETVSEEHAVRFDQMVERRLRHEPIQYILGYAEFLGLRLIVTPHVLIPRPETEEVAECAVESIGGRMSARILDVGTGSGCIALALKASRPDATVFACDVSSTALDVARRNAAANNLNVELFMSDVLGEGFTTDAPGKLDLIVSNPPYVTEQEAASLPPDVRAHEPHLALFAGEDPVIFYRYLARHGRALLLEGGRIVFEIHADYGEHVAAVVDEAGYADVEIRRDLAGRERIVLARR